MTDRSDEVTVGSRWRNGRSGREFVVIDVRDRHDMAAPYREARVQRTTGKRTCSWESVEYVAQHCHRVGRDDR